MKPLSISEHVDVWIAHDGLQHPRTGLKPIRQFDALWEDTDHLTWDEDEIEAWCAWIGWFISQQPHQLLHCVLLPG
jgi:hypothetical protein